jgi:hypothetical protein
MVETASLARSSPDTTRVRGGCADKCGHGKRRHDNRHFWPISVELIFTEPPVGSMHQILTVLKRIREEPGPNLTIGINGYEPLL